MSDEPIGWHVDKRLSIGHIITTLTVAVAVIAWMQNLESRVELNKQAITFNAQAIDKNNEDVRQSLLQLIVMVQRLEDKLDRSGDR